MATSACLALPLICNIVQDMTDCLSSNVSTYLFAVWKTFGTITNHRQVYREANRCTCQSWLCCSLPYIKSTLDRQTDNLSIFALCLGLLYTLDHEGAVTVFSTEAKNPSAKMATWSTTEDIGKKAAQQSFTILTLL